MALRPATSGQTVIANVTAVYSKSGIVRYTDPEPQALGYYQGSAFALAAATDNPPDEFGWRKPADYSGSLTKNEWARVSFQYSTWTTFSGSNTFIPGVPILKGLPKSFPLVCDQSLRLARNKALLELKDQTVNLGVAFKERQDTVNLVTELFTTLADSLKWVKTQIKAKKPKKPKKPGNPSRPTPGKEPRPTDPDWWKTPDAWLQYRYAIVPTMLDIFGAVEALEKRDNGHYDRYRVTVRGKSSKRLEGPKNLESRKISFGRYYAVNGQWVQTLTKMTYGARVRYDAKLVNPLYLSLSEAGVVNPLEVAWEATTLSFVADWALSVGDFCAAIDATLPYEFIGGSETTYVDWAANTTYYGPVTIVEHSGPATHFQFQRKAVDSFPWPDPFVLKQDPINLTRLADALSLISGALKSK